MMTSTTLQPYIRQPHYYETDQMGIIHHSNYIRWFEEARMDYLSQMGFGYARMEELGIISPVLSVNCNYKSVVKFSDTVMIQPRITSFNGIKMVLNYEIKDQKTGQLRTTGESQHCFVDRDFKPISLKKVNTHLYDLIRSVTEK
ncbi:MAG TPA: thioesterase family protein [Lachnospiraceae bacterium]|nr:thioesterase family protein [Lachnospiraceae bacterium]